MAKKKQRAAEQAPAKPLKAGRPPREPAAGLRGAFGQRIKTLREAKGMTGHDLAAATGLSKSRVYQIEAGETSTIDALAALAAGLGVPLEMLVRGLDK